MIICILLGKMQIQIRHILVPSELYVNTLIARQTYGDVTTFAGRPVSRFISTLACNPTFDYGAALSCISTLTRISTFTTFSSLCCASTAASTPFLVRRRRAWCKTLRNSSRGVLT